MFFGGLPISKDQQTLKENCPHIVVGTPGRLLALIRNKSLNLGNIKHFVLDECDKMLEQLGWFLHLKNLVKYLKQTRRKLNELYDVNWHLA